MRIFVLSSLLLLSSCSLPENFKPKAQPVAPPAASGFVAVAKHIACPSVGINLIAPLAAMSTTGVGVTLKNGASLQISASTPCFVEDVSQADLDELAKQQAQPQDAPPPPAKKRAP